MLVAAGSMVLFGCGGRDCSSTALAADAEKEAPAADLQKCGAADSKCKCDYYKKLVAFWQKIADDCSDDDTKKVIDAAINTKQPAYGDKTLKEWTENDCASLVV